MKKLAISTLLVLSTGSAFAWDVGVTGSRNTDTDRNHAGVTLGHNVGRLGVVAGFDRSKKDQVDQDRWSLLGTLDLTKLGKATVVAKAGGVRLDNKKGVDGNAFVAGVGLSMPLDKKVTASVDFSRQWGESAVKVFDGNQLSVGLKYKF